jgi:serine/threonine-protein kinase RsbW
MAPILENLSDTLADSGFSQGDSFAIRLAMEEAVVNAIKHGHGGDPDKQVRISYQIDAEEFRAEIEDEGPGFCPDSVADPLAWENLDREGGRGLFLMRYYMTEVCYNEMGNRVTLRKRRALE